MKLSIIIPVYNEIKTLPILIDKINQVILDEKIEKEIVVVDDNSDDGTYEFLQSIEDSIILIRHNRNLGKGGAVISGFKKAEGDFVLIQDADLEYNPDDYNKLLQPLLRGEVEVVYGSRFLIKGTIAKISFSSFMSNKFLTYLSNIVTGLKLTDMETGYKVFTINVIRNISSKLNSKGFGIEPQITSLVKKYKIKEVPISFDGRTKKEGKKIDWKDGLAAIWHIIYFNL